MPAPLLAFTAFNIHMGFGTGRCRAGVLRGVSMGATRGETVFLVGPSGSGKTTLLSILGCILTPDDGQLTIMGKDMAGMRPEQLSAFRRRHLGFIFQNFHLFPNLSALDNIRLALSMRGQSLRQATDQAADLLNQVGLWHRSHLRPAQLSTGECQRVAVARSLVNAPAILFADEPTASLDADNGQAVMKLLSRLVQERNVTLVVVTHDSRIFPFADRILQLEQGRLVHPDKASDSGPPPSVGQASSLVRPPWTSEDACPTSPDMPPNGRKELVA
jgi:putative ABC transport system ATP-binding protein